MATVGVIIASTVAEEEDTSPAVEAAVNVLMPPIVEAGHRQYALGAVAGLTVVRPCMVPMPQQLVVAPLMAPHIPRQRVVGRPMAPLMPQQLVVVAPLMVRLTAAAANRMVAANTTSR